MGGDPDHSRPPVGATTDKVPAGVENPIDAWLLAGTARLLPGLRATGHTPNVITTYSFLCGLLSVWFLRRGSVRGFAVCFALGYVFDCLDGQYARRYGMTSRFGDLYDHATDLAVYGAVCVTVWQCRRDGLRRPDIAVAFALALAGLLVNIGCQQRLHRRPDREWETLDLLRGLCPCERWVHWSRYTGYATFNLLSVALVAYLFRRRPNG